MMIRKPYLRRILLVSVLAIGLASTPPVEARAAAARSLTSWVKRAPNPLLQAWQWLRHLWGKEGSSMDPYGHH